MQGQPACRAGEPSGQGEEPPPEGLGGGYPLSQTDPRRPAGQVVGHRLDGQPGAVGGEAARGEMVQPDAVLEVAYGILDLGVAAMVSLQFEHLPVPVGDEAVIAVFGEEGQLGTGRGLHTPDDEPHRRGVRFTLEGSAGGLGHIGGAVHPVGNGSPGILGYRLDEIAQALVLLHGFAQISIIRPVLTRKPWQMSGYLCLPGSRREEMVARMLSARSARREKLAKAEALMIGLDEVVMDALGLLALPQDSRQVFAVRHQVAQLRLDPHFHSPEFARVQQMLSQVKCETLGSIASLSKETWRPQDHDQPTFQYIEIATVDPRTGEADWNTVPTDEAPSRARMRIRVDDLIISLTRPHHGSIAHLGPEFEGCVASTGFAVVRDVADYVHRDYLWCVLRTRMCLSQMLQRASGGNYPAITEAELRNILVPIPDQNTQHNVAAEAVRRLDEARRLRAEADGDQQEAKQWFEGQLMGMTFS